jgi:hypothetical protein
MANGHPEEPISFLITVTTAPGAHMSVKEEIQEGEWPLADRNHITTGRKLQRLRTVRIAAHLPGRTAEVQPRITARGATVPQAAILIPVLRIRPQEATLLQMVAEHEQIREAPDLARMEEHEAEIKQ